MKRNEKEKKIGWVNIYKHSNTNEILCNCNMRKTKALADELNKIEEKERSVKRIACIKVEF